MEPPSAPDGIFFHPYETLNWGSSFSALLISIKEWPLLCDLSDRPLPSIKCQSDCVESQLLLLPPKKTDAKVLSEVPGPPSERKAHWLTGSCVPGNHCQLNLISLRRSVWNAPVCMLLRGPAHTVSGRSATPTSGSGVWSGISVRNHGAVMPPSLLHMLASVPLVSLFSDLWPLLYLLPPPLLLLCHLYFSCAISPPSPLSLSCQGLPGRSTLRVPSRRGGERERDHLQCEGRDARPGAAVGEGADGRPQPRLSARWGHIVKLRLRRHGASLYLHWQVELWPPPPPLVGFIQSTLRSHVGWSTHTTCRWSCRPHCELLTSSCFS